MRDTRFLGAHFEYKFAEDNDPAGTFEGYAAVFGNIDAGGDRIEPGAFAAGLLSREREGRALPPMYKMHGSALGGRDDPIGVWKAMSEDANGLYVKGALVGLDTESGRWTYAQMKEGALPGLSIGYRVPPNGSRKGSGKGGEPLRYIKQAWLREVSLVDDPMNVLARVYGMKRADFDLACGEIKTIRDFEDFLRDVGGFSDTAAKAIASCGFRQKADPRDEAATSEIKSGIADIFGRLASTISAK